MKKFRDIERLLGQVWWVVLSGSGMRMYAFLGALLAYSELGVRFSGMTTTSGGSVVGGVLSKHWDPNNQTESIRKAIERAKKINPGKLMNFRWAVWQWMLTKLFRTGPRGPIKTDKILNVFRREMPATIGDGFLPLRICSYQVNLKNPVPVVFSDPDTDLPLAVLGSMALPVFDPVKYGVAILQDGGWVRNFNIPEDERHVIGLYFGSIQKAPGSGIITDPAMMRKLNDNIDLMASTIGGVINDNMRRSVEEAEEEGVDLEKLSLNTDMSTLDFFASEEKIAQTIEDGYNSVMLAYGGRQKELT